MYALFWTVISWITRDIIIKFFVIVGIYALVAMIVPFAVEFIQDFIVIQALNSAFTALPPGIWYFVDLFRLDFGLPLLISGSVSAFLVSRLPIIG